MTAQAQKLRLARFRLAAAAEFGAVRVLNEAIGDIRQRIQDENAAFASLERYRRPVDEEALQRHTAKLDELSAELSAAEELQADYRARAHANDGNARTIANYLGED